MKYTILSLPNGTIVMTIPHRDSKAILGDYTNVKRIGDINESRNGYSVTFLDEKLSKYARDGFDSYDEAIAYEQDILNAHLEEKFAV